MWPYPLAAVVVLLLALPTLSSRRLNPAGLSTVVLAACTAILTLYALLCVLLLLMTDWKGVPHGALRTFVWGPPLFLLSLAASIAIQVAMLGRQSESLAGEWCNRLAAWLGICATGWAAVAASAVYGPWIFNLAVTSYLWESLTVAAGWMAAFVGGLLGGRSGTTGAGGTSIRTAVKELGAAMAPVLFIAALLIGVSSALHHIILINAAVEWQELGALPSTSQGSFLAVSMFILANCTGMLLLVALRVDVNEFSLTSLYRNRLVRCYLGAARSDADRSPENAIGFDVNDIALHALVGRPGPLHLINTAVNLGASTDLAPHGRQIASFTLSPLFCGSSYQVTTRWGKVTELGYAQTSSYRYPPLTLGQAIAISGAAANPNVGHHPAPAVASLLTLFNLRFGWYFPNPRRPRSADRPGFSLRHVVAELLSGTNERSQYLMLSDGGHFDNTGLYELVMRRCRVILMVDAEYDPQLTCPALTRAIHLCEQHFGVTIRIDLAGVRAIDPTARGAQPFALGTLTYDDGSVATLVYMKAVMAGIDDTTLSNYKAGRAAFPHEDVGLAFESDDQFDSYRRLGQLVAQHAFLPFLDAEGAVDWNLVRFPTKLLRPRGGAPRIFISYRRSDASGYAQLLHSYIVQRFGRPNVFIDVRGIEPGKDYPSALHATLQSCDAALIVIGPGWLSASTNGRRRLDDANDWVRAELAAVLSRDVLVVPVLVGGAEVPDPGDLPADISSLAERQGVALPDRELLTVLGTLLDDLEMAIERAPARA